MKSELELQKMVVDAVNGAGGFAHKMNNRFLIGVSDLIVKLPTVDNMRRGGVNPPAGFLEVKQDRFPTVTGVVAVDITGPQFRFLDRTHAAGMPAGVLSFIQSGRGATWRCWMSIRCLASYRVSRVFAVQDYVGWERSERDNVILSCLHNWHKEWREGS